MNRHDGGFRLRSSSYGGQVGSNPPYALNDILKDAETKLELIMAETERSKKPSP
jgi:hypothetical protein